MTHSRILVALALVWPLPAQPPVVSPRGVINGTTQQPAPSAVSPGGLIWINGLNLSPGAEIKATGATLPTELGDPAIRVRVNQRLAPLFSISPGKIVAQVPLETPMGLATITVQRGDQTSRPARITVIQPTPAIRNLDDAGFGSAAGSAAGDRIKLTVTGLGQTDPAVATGQSAPEPGVAPRLAVRASVGGLPAKAATSLSVEKPGEFEVEIEIPVAAKPGDLVTLSQAGRLSNFATFQKQSQPESLFVPLPEGTPDIRALQPAGLRSVFLGASAARGTDGCYPSWLIDSVAKTASRVEGCLTAAIAQLATPFVASADGNTLAAFFGTPAGQNQATDKVKIFSPMTTAPVDVSLPAVGQLLAGVQDGNFQALLTGTAGNVLIDSSTGETRPVQGGGGAVVGIPGVGGGGLGGGGLTLDLGDGLKSVLSQAVNIGNNQRYVIVGDNTDNPTKTKLAVINQQNQVTASRDFPSGWLALASPAPQLPAGGIGGGGAGALANRQSAVVTFDAITRSFLVLSRTADNARHGFVSFRTDNAESSALELPERWFVAACTPQIRIFTIELTRRIGLLGAASGDREFKNPCPADGFLLFDLDEAKFTAVSLPGSGQFSATQGTDELNDYIFGSNIDPARQGAADTLYMLDGVTATPFRLDLPAGLNGFSQLRAVRDLNLLVGLGRARTLAGDGGLVIFDLDRAQGSVLSPPDGFATVQLLDIFPATRKVIARGIRTGNTGAQILIYDLATGDVTMVANPEGVAFVGTPPAVPGQPGQGGGGVPGQPQAPVIVLRSTPRAQTVEAVTYAADRRQNGILVIRVP